jgi:hypothetical protein
LRNGLCWLPANIDKPAETAASTAKSTSDAEKPKKPQRLTAAETAQK